MTLNNSVMCSFDLYELWVAIVCKHHRISDFRTSFFDAKSYSVSDTCTDEFVGFPGIGATGGGTVKFPVTDVVSVGVSLFSDSALDTFSDFNN